MQILEITIIASEITALAHHSDRSLQGLVQVVLAFLAAVQQADESQKSWGVLARRSRDILIALSQSRTVAPGFSSQTDRLTAFFNTIQEYYTNEVQAFHRVERVFRANKIRRRIEQFCRELSVLWQGVKLALNINSNDMLNEADLRQAVQHDDAQNQALIAQITTLLQQNNTAVLDQVDIRLNQQEWKIRQATDAIQNLLQEGDVTQRVVEKAVAPLLHMLQNQSSVSRSMKHELWRIPAGSITNRSLEPIARGGFGEVFTATYYGSDVAVKQLLTSYHETEIAQFRREIEVWYKLSHSNVLPLHGACDTTERPFMVSPFMPNGTLRDYVANNPRSLDDRLRLMYEVASGMSYLHARRIIHGDLKAANVLLDKSFQAIVTDFGLSRTKHTSASMNPNRNGGSTGGSEGYMAPEMLDEENPTGTTMKTDVYAFAITLYEVLNNAKPVWVASNGRELEAAQILSRIIQQKQPNRLDDIPDHIWSLIEACWHQDPAMRPTFGDIVSILAAFKDVTTPQPPIGSPRTLSDFSRQMRGLSTDRSGSRSSGYSANASLVPPALAQRLGTEFVLPRAVIMGIQRGDTKAHTTAARKISEEKPVNDPAWTAAAELYQIAADKGDAEAAFELAWLHFAGIGITKSDTEAFAYWQLVHDKSTDAIMKPIATFMMGWCCYLGRGTRRDEIKANQWLIESRTPDFELGEYSVRLTTLIASSKPAAVRLFELCQFGSQHDWLCKHLVARFMVGGFGTVDDRQAAACLFQELADQGHAMSQFLLAKCYAEGYGVDRDDTKALEWFTKSAEKGNSCGQNAVGVGCSNGQGVTRDYDRAVEWYTKSANQGNVDAQNNLGVCYYKGNGVAQDFSKAFEWFTKAANQGYAGAQFNLGVCYENGQGVDQDNAKAVEWYTKAAGQGNANAQFGLGVCYYKGNGVAQDYTKAAEWYNKAANQGNADSQFKLGFCYQHGKGVAQDYTKAVEWYNKAAHQGNCNGQFNLGRCYSYGSGVAQDDALAVEWITKSASQGHSASQEWLDIRNQYANSITGRINKFIETKHDFEFRFWMIPSVILLIAILWNMSQPSKSALEIS